MVLTKFATLFVKKRISHKFLAKQFVHKTLRAVDESFEDFLDAIYNDSELDEFKVLIHEKLKKAKEQLELINSAYKNDSNNGTDDTSPTFKAFDEGSEVMSKETASQLAIRQEKFIRDLKNALIRIENKTYGICRVTGKLINPERLKLVPHATLSIEAKNMQQ